MLIPIFTSAEAGNSEAGNSEAGNSEAGNSEAGIVSTPAPGVVHFVFDHNTSVLQKASVNLSELLGVERALLIQGGGLFLRCVHPDDRFFLLSVLEEAFTSGGIVNTSYRWIVPSTGKMIGIALIGSVQGDYFSGVLIETSQVAPTWNSANDLLPLFPQMLSKLSDLNCLVDQESRICWMQRSPKLNETFKSNNLTLDLNALSDGSIFWEVFRSHERRLRAQRKLLSLLDPQSEVSSWRFALPLCSESKTSEERIGVPLRLARKENKESTSSETSLEFCFRTLLVSGHPKYVWIQGNLKLTI